MPKIALPQKNITLEVPPLSNLMAVLQENKIPVASSCLGEGICGKCRLVIQGEVTAPTELEIQTVERNKIPVGERLCCQIAVTADLVVASSYW